jgi:hypothetical protein
MGRFAPKYPAYCREAITAAVARDMPAKEIGRQLASGELDGLDGNPWPMPERALRSAHRSGELRLCMRELTCHGRAPRPLGEAKET